MGTDMDEGSELDRKFISLADCFIAYRKAKFDAFYDNHHWQALAFGEYETDLSNNLKTLLAAIYAHGAAWPKNPSILGGFFYTPKSLTPSGDDKDQALFYRCLDPIEEWRRICGADIGTPAKASYRLMIMPSVEFQIISALWIMKVGHKLDEAVSDNLSYGNRLRRHRNSDAQLALFHPSASLNLDCFGLFTPFPFPYRQWRENGLKAMQRALELGVRVVAITMDLQKFYHRVNPRFVLRSGYLKAIGVTFSSSETIFTELLLNAIDKWYSTTPDSKTYPTGALPVGLSASKVLSNALLADFDRQFNKKVSPLYYGRYVDDLFVVLSYPREMGSGSEVLDRLVGSIPEMLSVEGDNQDRNLRLSLPYADDSELVFGSSKQKIFNLSGAYGLDLITHIRHQIRRQSSEHRLLPVLPDSGQEMASRALLAQSDASLEVDALRKADVISVRRLGFSMLLRDMESYARDLPASASGWATKRREFYGLVQRHVIAPQGFFTLFTPYVKRIFALMVSCADYDAAAEFVDRLHQVLVVLDETTQTKAGGDPQLVSCRAYCARELVEAALQASSVLRFRWTRRFLALMTRIRRISGDLRIPATTLEAKRLSKRIFAADFGRRPYRESWLGRGSLPMKNPPVPTQLGVRRVLRLGAIRAFRVEAGLPRPYWPATAFPTRPLNLSEITFAAPSLLHKPHRLRAALFALRGARARRHEGFGLIPSEIPGTADDLLIHIKRESNPVVAVPSFLTSNADWIAAVKGRPRLNAARFERIRRIINEVSRQYPRPNYLVLPECSLPRGWSTAIASKLAQQGISLIAGLEYQITSRGVRNDALVSLTTDWPWYSTSVSYVQPKQAPSHEERALLKANGSKRLYRPDKEITPVYVHGDFCFGVVICSDLTNAHHRVRYKGAVDALFVLEWNPDVETFGFLIEATAHDLHAYVVQVNNRQFGDSRIRVPRKIDYERDVMRVKGGLTDYFVTAEIDVHALRTFQRRPIAGSAAPFKPLPIGFRMSRRRRNGSS
jgi:predicted amidohydrolase